MDINTFNLASASAIPVIEGGRITIPKEVREEWNLKKGDTLLFWFKNKTAMVIVPLKFFGRDKN